MPHNRLPGILKNYRPTGIRNQRRPCKKLLDMSDRNASTSSPNTCQLDDDDDDDDKVVRKYLCTSNVRYFWMRGYSRNQNCTECFRKQIALVLHHWPGIRWKNEEIKRRNHKHDVRTLVRSVVIVIKHYKNHLYITT